MPSRRAWRHCNNSGKLISSFAIGGDFRGELIMRQVPGRQTWRRMGQRDPRVVGLLRSASERFSIAVHGCDHAAAEYSSTDGAWLEGTSSCALDRMEQHKRRTGMPFDNVMVFPQGRFSIEAISALKNCGFAAAVNTTLWAVDWPKDPRSE